MKWLKVVAAKFLKRRMAFPTNELQADKWNHLSAIISTNGRVKWDKFKVHGVPTIRCSRCIKVMRVGEGPKEMCDGCRKIQEAKKK